MQSPLRYVWLICLLSLVVITVQAEVGDSLPNLTPRETALFDNGQRQFLRLWGLKQGVGPVLTDGACSRCHSVPVLGGGNTRHWTFFGLLNPDGTFDPLDGSGPSGLNEGGILLQPLSNQAFLPNCSQGGEKLPPNANAIEDRITPQTFGFGLVDAIADADLINQAAFELSNYQADGIHGVAATVPTYYAAAPNKIGRFGQKAQFANLIEMAAWAFAQGMGITNPLFVDENLPQGMPIDPNCTLNSDVPNNTNAGSGGSGIFPISHFMRFTAPIVPAKCPGTDCAQGQAIFTAIGCDKCHLRSYATPTRASAPMDLAGNSVVSRALSRQKVKLYSDLLLHDLGNADKGSIPENQTVTGVAKLSQWRTAPLWGIQYRTRYLHNGAAQSLDAAIRGHSDDATGEAVTVINRYKALSPFDQQALLDFLNTL